MPNGTVRHTQEEKDAPAGSVHTLKFKPTGTAGSRQFRGRPTQVRTSGVGRELRGPEGAARA